MTLQIVQAEDDKYSNLSSRHQGRPEQTHAAVPPGPAWSDYGHRIFCNDESLLCPSAHKIATAADKMGAGSSLLAGIASSVALAAPGAQAAAAAADLLPSWQERFAEIYTWQSIWLELVAAVAIVLYAVNIYLVSWELKAHLCIAYASCTPLLWLIHSPAAPAAGQEPE